MKNSATVKQLSNSKQTAIEFRESVRELKRKSFKKAAKSSRRLDEMTAFPLWVVRIEGDGFSQIVFRGAGFQCRKLVKRWKRLESNSIAFCFAASPQGSSNVEARFDQGESYDSSKPWQVNVMSELDGPKYWNDVIFRGSFEDCKRIEKRWHKLETDSTVCVVRSKPGLMADVG